MDAQLNIKAGFTSLYTPAPQHNSIVKAFNDQLTDVEMVRLQNPMPDLHFLNGLQIGARYKMRDFALDVTWENVLRKRTGNGEHPVTQSLIQKEYFYNINTISLNLESFISDNFVFSLGVGRRNLRIRRFIGGSNVKIDLFEEKQFQYLAIAKLLIILSPDARTPIALIPYYVYPLAKIGLEDFANDIGAGSTNESDRFISMGVSIVYYYGN